MPMKTHSQNEGGPGETRGLLSCVSDGLCDVLLREELVMEAKGATSAMFPNSGGADSRTAAAIADALGWKLRSFYVDWTGPWVGDNQRRAAAETAERYCVSHEVLPLEPRMAYWHESLNKRSIAFQSSLMALFGAELAVRDGLSWIVTGDRPEVQGSGWLGAMQELLNVHRARSGIVIVAPVWDLSEDEVTAKAIELGVDLDSTWSCTVSAPHCGECGPCLRRKRQGIALW